MKRVGLCLFLVSWVLTSSCNYSNTMEGNRCISNCGISFVFPDDWVVDQNDGSYEITTKESQRRAEKNHGQFVSKIKVLFIADPSGSEWALGSKLPDEVKLEEFALTSKGEIIVGEKEGKYLIGQLGNLRKYYVESLLGDCYTRFTLISDSQFFEEDSVAFISLLESIEFV